MPFLHCKNELKRAQNVQNSEFAYYAFAMVVSDGFWDFLELGESDWANSFSSGLVFVSW